MAVSAQEPDARQQRNVDTLKRFSEVMVGMGRNEQCKVLNESRSKRYSDDVAKITMALEKQKEIPGQQLLGVIIDATAATGSPESAAGCDEATRQLVEAGSEKAKNWADELRRGRSRSNSTQGK
ncbi:hypothetical protein [Lysobacter sp. CA199]|uniref:hypothetical protein n=1 Tax=Lysobacter sp. CA199 TaxID=3455608 RepID=UPI003F8D8000